ncbi:transposase, MuDR, MULE transposase domain protein [Tanacetum coccineum]
MASNIKNFKCLIHFNETRRGSILSEDLTYSMLHEMVMQKFNLEANAEINFSFKLSSFDFAVDITDDAEVQLFVGCACNSKDEFAQSNEYNTDDVVNENPQKKFHKWQKFMSFEPDIPETPVYRAKPNISKQYTQQSEVEKGNIFDNKEALILAVRLKALNKDDKGVFEMLFIAIGASIRTFFNYLRPVLMIDVAHLKGLYKGTNLVAVSMDGNNQIVPIAFGICKGETGPCWSWWMSVLKECIGDNTNFLFISDRHPAIAMVVENEFPLAFHVVCCRHLMQNLSLKNKKRKGLFWKTCKVYIREDYATSMNILQNVQPDAYEKLCRAGPQRWSRAHCPLVRYNYMTSNSVEFVNACNVIYRKEPVSKLAETYRAMVQECRYDTYHTISPISIVLSSIIESCLSNTHIFSSLTYYMAYGANEARQTIVLKLQREIQAEETIADQLLCNLTRYTEEMRIRSIQITMLQSMPTTSLNTYGLHALLMTHEADIRTTNNILRTRQQLLRSISAKQNFVNNYMAI